MGDDRKVTYRDAGVDVDKADAWIDDVRTDAASTARPGVISGVGGFAALFALQDAGPRRFEDPLLVSGTDGVGTKLMVAIAANRHDTVGIDLVAMCVNDVVTTGAEPLFFLDYFGTGHLEPEVARQVVAGVAEGCRQAGCALVGGETAELPGLYASGDYDLAGFCLGAVERADHVTGERVAQGDAVVGVFSRGIHSNGYSLARKILLEIAGLKLSDPLPGADGTVGEVLLTPTPIYAGLVRRLMKTVDVRAMAHITGGGIGGNVPRVLPTGTVAQLDRSKWPVPSVFSAIQRLGPVADEEMLRTFNMGLGYVVVVPEDDVDEAIRTVEAAGHTGGRVGTIETGTDGAPPVVRWYDESEP